MRQHTTPLTYELNSDGGAKTINITPGAAAQAGRFVISGIDPRIQDMRNYLTRFWAHLQTTFNQQAAGAGVAVVNWDQFYKQLQSLELISPIMGVVYPHKHTRGAVLGHVMQVPALGYTYPQPARTQIPVGAAAFTIDLFYNVAMAHEDLFDPMETAQWAGFFDGGTLEMIVAPSTTMAVDSTGSNVGAPTTLRCLAETLPSQREYLGVPFQYRDREIAGGGTSPVLKNVGGETSLNGIRPGCGLGGLWWLSSGLTATTATSTIGLAGPCTVDNLTAVSMTWRGQKQVLNLDGFFHYLRSAMEKRTGPISGGAVLTPDSAGYPFAMAPGATPDVRPSQNPQAMFLPLITPGRKTMTSKVQRVLGDLQVDFQVTNPISTSHHFITFELLEFSDDQVASMAALGRFNGPPSRNHATAITSDAKASNLRYTAIEFKGG